MYSKEFSKLKIRSASTLQKKEERKKTYFADVMKCGQLKQLRENVQGSTKETAKLLVAVVKVQCHLGDTLQTTIRFLVYQ